MPLSNADLLRLEELIRTNKPLTKADAEALIAEVREYRPISNPERTLLQSMHKATGELRVSMGRGSTPGKIRISVALMQKAIDDYAP